MRKRLAAWLFGVVFVVQGDLLFAQYLPTGPSRAPISEPIPLGPSGGQIAPPAFGPGPMSGGDQDGAEDLSLSPRIPSAFMEDPSLFEETWYGSVGARALKRQSPRSLSTAYLNATNTDLVATPNFSTLPMLQNFNQLQPPVAWGPLVTLGYIYNNHMFEFTGFYIPQNSTTQIASVPGQVSSPFGSIPAPGGYAPVGFQGNNGLWLNADSVTTTLNNAIGNVEFNYRRASNALKDVEFLFGIRYFDILENMVVSTSDDGVVFPANPTLQANYNARTHNSLLGLQLGYEHNMKVLQHLGIGSFAKGSAGVNWWDADVSLVRGDGLIGFQGGQSGATFASVIEIALYADLLLLERCRMRAGYNVLWAIGVAEASTQFNYDLRDTNGSREIGTTFYSGPSLEFQFLF